MKYIQNVHIAAFKCETIGNPKLEITFQPETLDRSSNRAIYTGFTPVTDEQYAALTDEKTGSAVFNYFVSEEAGRKIVVHDSLPEAVQTPQDMITNLRETVHGQALEIEDLKSKLEAGAGKAAKAQIEDLQKKILEISAERDGLAVVVDGLKAAAAADGATIESVKAALGGGSPQF